MTKFTAEYFINLGYDFGNACEMALAESESSEAYNEAAEMIEARAEFERMEKISNWLSNYKGDFEFYVSVKAQYERKNYLSEKQKEAVERAILRDNARITEVAEKASNYSPEVEWHNPTFKAGTALKISKGVAKAIAEDKGFDIAFRKVEVLKTHRETPKAVFVTVKFSAQVGHFCGICGRGLTHPVSQATGIGPECASKLGITRYSMDAAKRILNEIGVKLSGMGEVKIWLPRSKVEVM